MPGSVAGLVLFFGAGVLSSTIGCASPSAAGADGQGFYFCTSFWALYCLALFFVVARKDLAPVKPLSKFLVVKGIVFFTWAQSLAISLAFYFVYDFKVPPPPPPHFCAVVAIYTF